MLPCSSLAGGVYQSSEGQPERHEENREIGRQADVFDCRLRALARTVASKKAVVSKVMELLISTRPVGVQGPRV